MGTEAQADLGRLAEGLRTVYGARDLEAFGALLAPDVHWGGDDPWGCHGRADVLALYRERMAGLTAEVSELRAGSAGVLCSLTVHPVEHADGEGRAVFHVYLVRDGLIQRILGFRDRDSAAAAAGVPAAVRRAPS